VRVIVTGINGYVAAAVAERLLRDGHEVAGIGRKERCSFPSRSGRFSYIRADLAGRARLDFPADYIVHAAARTPGPRWRAGDYARDNVWASMNVLEMAGGLGVRGIVFLSSFSVYGGCRQAVIDEASPVVAPDAYGMSKLMAERLFLEGAVPSLVLRIPAVVGAGARSILPVRLARQARQGCITASNPDALFNHLLRDAALADFIATLLARGWSRSRLVLLGASVPMTMAGVAGKIAQWAGAGAEIVWKRGQPGPGVISTALAEGEYGYEPETVSDILDFFLEKLAPGAQSSP